MVSAASGRSLRTQSEYRSPQTERPFYTPHARATPPQRTLSSNPPDLGPPHIHRRVEGRPRATANAEGILAFRSETFHQQYINITFTLHLRGAMVAQSVLQRPGFDSCPGSFALCPPLSLSHTLLSISLYHNA